MSRYTKVCVDCGGDKPNDYPGSWMRQRCKPCGANFDRYMMAANGVINRAKARGLLDRAAEHKCVDCGAQALDWDHRDYTKPLEVEPVCRACNLKRGPALYPKLEAATGGELRADPECDKFRVPAPTQPATAAG